ncbi:MAG: phytanoyl-CoA dioxygenase family protein [Chitinophagales bacterium]|nr:phytanoyl-CoA dioxygenase family protein [Chitinophagales bacterium]MDW8417808.1 phytanoyl-CoA dioxygenase family protein [Chitinophagales bacterium]
MINYITKIFKPSLRLPTLQENKYYRIRMDSFFINDDHHAKYLQYGWVKIEQVIRQDEIDRFMQTFDEISKLDGFELDKHLLNSGRLFNPEIRKKVQQVINELAPVILPRLFDMQKTDTHTGGAFQVKPPHPNSDLLIHQDSTVIDEESDYCLFVWIPFCDVTMENGVVSFVSGSHLWGNTQRSLGVPWQFKNYIPILYKHAHPVTVKKGDVIVFDPACIHASAPNLGTEIRHAITMTVLRKNYQLVYYFRNPELPLDQIEKYYVTEEFYYTYDFISKPDETLWRKEIVPYKYFDYSEKEMLELIRHYTPKVS